MKPRIRLSRRYPGLWVCTGGDYNNYSIGYGSSPFMAYIDWCVI